MWYYYCTAITVKSQNIDEKCVIITCRQQGCVYLQILVIQVCVQRLAAKLSCINSNQSLLTCYYWLINSVQSSLIVECYSNWQLIQHVHAIRVHCTNFRPLPVIFGCNFRPITAISVIRFGLRNFHSFSIKILRPLRSLKSCHSWSVQHPLRSDVNRCGRGNTKCQIPHDWHHVSYDVLYKTQWLSGGMEMWCWVHSDILVTQSSHGRLLNIRERYLWMGDIAINDDAILLINNMYHFPSKKLRKIWHTHPPTHSQNNGFSSDFIPCALSTFSLHRKISLNLRVQFCVSLSIKHITLHSKTPIPSVTY